MVEVENEAYSGAAREISRGGYEGFRVIVCGGWWMVDGYPLCYPFVGLGPLGGGMGWMGTRCREIR